MDQTCLFTLAQQTSDLSWRWWNCACVVPTQCACGEAVESEGEQVVWEMILEPPIAEKTIASEINMSNRLDKATTKPWFSEWVCFTN